MKDREIRRLPVSKIELREQEGEKVIKGYAVVWDEISPDYYGFKEVFRKGAFTKTLQESKIYFVHGHDLNSVLGQNRNGTLNLVQDDVGLRFELKVPNTQLGNDIYTLVKDGTLSEMSFRFAPIKENVEIDEEKEEVLREIKEAQLWEISTVAFAWYRNTYVEARKVEIERIKLKAKHGIKLSEKEREKLIKDFEPYQQLLVEDNSENEPVQDESKDNSHEEEQERLRLLKLRSMI